MIVWCGVAHETRSLSETNPHEIRIDPAKLPLFAKRLFCAMFFVRAGCIMNFKVGQNLEAASVKN
jgi:hypothetical protein